MIWNILVCFSHTSELEICHALYNKWVPKSLHFSFLKMVCRSQLTAIYLNLWANLELSGRENASSLKITKTWSIKPIKVNKDKNKFARMIKRVVSVVESGKILPLPEIPILPRNIAPGYRPNKEEVLRNDTWYHDLIFHIKRWTTLYTLFKSLRGVRLCSASKNV